MLAYLIHHGPVSLVPAERLPLPPGSQLRLNQSIFRVFMEGIAAIITDEVTVGLLVLAADDPVDPIVRTDPFGIGSIHSDTAPGAALRTDRRRVGQVPDPGGVDIVFQQQGAHRTDVRYVARQRIIQRLSIEYGNFVVIAPVLHEQLAGSGNLPGKTDAPGTHDTAVKVNDHARSQFFVGPDPLIFDKPAVGMAVLE